jgi:hypothetical protein
VLAFTFSTDLDNGTSAVTFVDPSTGEVETYDDQHPLFKALTGALIANDVAEVRSLLQDGVSTRVSKGLLRLSERVQVDGDTVTFDGTPVHTTVAATLRRWLHEDRDTKGLVKFMELVDANPSRHSREQLWTWIERAGLTVDEDGYVLGYKAIASDGLSIHAGTDKVYVDGVEHTGRIPNRVGAVVAMDRRDVDDDFSKDCSYGLHVGTYEYANSFGGSTGILTEVRFSPADVVSVPSYDTNKLRTSRYEVLAVHLPEVGDDLSQYEPPAAHEDSVALAEALDDLVEAGEAPAAQVNVIKRALRLIGLGKAK